MEDLDIAKKRWEITLEHSKDFIESTNDLKPKEETVNFLLNYSKALSVINCNKLKFETFLN